MEKTQTVESKKMYKVIKKKINLMWKKEVNYSGPNYVWENFMANYLMK